MFTPCLDLDIIRVKLFFLATFRAFLFLFQRQTLMLAYEEHFFHAKKCFKLDFQLLLLLNKSHNI